MSTATDRDAVQVVATHPRVAGLGSDPADQASAEAFARDLASWLVGTPRSELAPLARVVTAVAGRALRDTRSICRGRPLPAVEAAARTTEELWPWLRHLARPEEEDEDEDEGLDEGEGAGGDGGGGGGAMDALQALAGGTDADSPDLESLAERLGPGDGGEIELRIADLVDESSDAGLSGALEVSAASRLLERFVPGVGWSRAPGAMQRTLLEHLDKLARVLARLDDLRRLADALGRVESESRKRGQRHGGMEEVVGVHYGGDVAHALPSELGLLGDAGTEDLFYQRLMEHRLVSLELSGRGLGGSASGDERGPVIACVDTSSSMRGPAELGAKALVLAVCRRLLPQGRAVHLILFGGPDERTELRLRQGTGGLETLLDFITMSFDGGTDFDGPLVRALELLDEEDLSRADILVVTDGRCRADPSVHRRVHEARHQRGVRVYGAVLGRGDRRGVEPFCDEVWEIEIGSGGAAATLSRLRSRP